MRLSRRTFLAGGAGAMAAGALAISVPGGGPRTYFGGMKPWTDFAPLGSTFSPAELKSELAWLVETLRAVGARPFAYTDEAAFDARYRETLASLDRPMRAGEAYLRMAPLVASLNDGHAALLYGRDFDDWFWGNGQAFPFVLTLNEHGVFVDASTDARIPRGSKLLEIDGMPAQLLSNDLVALTGGQQPSLRLDFAGEGVQAYFYARYGPRERFQIRAELPSGAIRSFTVRAAGVKAIQHAQSANAKTALAAYTFARIAGGRVGYIDYRSCENAVAFRQFLEKTFGSIKREPVEGLIVDIRSNGGGNSSLNDDLWSYAQGKPFSQGGKMTVHVASRLKREYGFLKYNDVYPPPSWFFPDQTNLTLDFTRFTTVTPGENPLRYHGPVYLLIGRGTFSSAMMCAVAAKDYGLATLVGEETGEPANSTGEVYEGLSPRIGLRFDFTTKYFWAPKPRPDGQGVLPDVRVVPTEDDIRRGRDPVLAYAIRAITGA